MDEPWASPSNGRKCRFGVFEFDGQTLELCKSGRSVSVRPQPLKLLALLLAGFSDLLAYVRTRRESSLSSVNQ